MKISGPKRVEITRECEKFSNEDLHDFHHSPGRHSSDQIENN